MDFLIGSKDKVKQLPNMTPEQMSVLQQLLGGLGGGMGSGMDYLQSLLSGEEGAFDAYEAPMKRQFEEQTVPGLAEQFSSLGSGAQGSSAFGQALGQAGAGLTENLAAQRAQLRSGAMQQLSQLMGIGLGAQPFGYNVQKGQAGMLPSMSQGFGSAIGKRMAGWL